MAMFERIREDIRSVLERDPAARSWLEVVTCYPGLWAVWIHRVSHRLWSVELRLPARLLSQFARLFTGVDIHPAALLGRRLFIDHATGVVIGETAIVGSDVTMYQGVTLGGTGKGHGKRHPTICDRVFIGNNANVLGNITVGENSRVGAGSVVLADVPPNSTVVGVPAHIVYRNGAARADHRSARHQGPALRCADRAGRPGGGAGAAAGRSRPRRRALCRRRSRAQRIQPRIKAGGIRVDGRRDLSRRERSLICLPN